VRLFGNLSFEGDALFRGYRYEQSSGFNAIPSGAGLTNINSVVPIFSSFRQDAKEWDIPLLLKYRLHAGPLRPFVDAGFEFAHVSSDFTSSTTCLGTADACNASGLTAFFYPSASYHSSVNRRGPAAGVGLEFKYGRLRIAPEVRYTRLDRPNANEVTVMAGFTF
jgi:opacity protein-like surface antigen